MEPLIIINNNDIYDKIYILLSNKDYYSLSIFYASKKLNISVPFLRSLDIKTNGDSAIEFKKRFNDYINGFMYKHVEYIGLESHRIVYEIDKINGTNWVETAIKKGFYD